MNRRRLLAETLWSSIVSAYHQGGRTKVDLPVDEVVDVLLNVAANAISQLPDPMQRARIMQEMAPKVNHIIETARRRPNVHIPSRGSGLVLPQ